MNPQLTISIVNWNVRDYLEKCLESIFKYSDGINLETIVVDNASCDGSLNMVKEKFPQVITIQNNENLGYGLAHNQVIKIAKGKYILFLNPDTEMLADTLSQILKFMDVHPEAGACRCVAVRDKKDINEFIALTRFDKFVYSFLKTIHTRFPNPITAHFCMNIVAKSLALSHSNFTYTEDSELEGSFLLVRMDALKQAGDFNPRFYLGDEGYDLTRRIAKFGWKLYHVVSVRIIHHKSKSIEQISDAQHEENRKQLEKRFDNRTDKGSNGHYFTEVYEYFFYPIKNEARKIFEIGVAEGASLKMFRDYFPKAIIYGIDINDASDLNSDTIKTFVADQANRKQLKDFIDTYGYDFDIILDDGGHTMEQQQVSFGYLFKYLKPGGYYIIEDVHTSLYGAEYGVEKNEKNATLIMISNFIRNGRIRSIYMAAEEEDYLAANIKYCNLLSKNSGDSITCLFKKE